MLQARNLLIGLGDRGQPRLLIHDGDSKLRLRRRLRREGTRV